MYAAHAAGRSPCAWPAPPPPPPPFTCVRPGPPPLPPKPPPPLLPAPIHPHPHPHCCRSFYFPYRQSLSTCKLYYSYDVAGAHVIMLSSYSRERTPGRASGGDSCGSPARPFSSCFGVSSICVSQPATRCKQQCRPAPLSCPHARRAPPPRGAVATTCSALGPPPPRPRSLRPLFRAVRLAGARPCCCGPRAHALGHRRLPCALVQLQLCAPGAPPRLRLYAPPPKAAGRPHRCRMTLQPCIAECCARGAPPGGRPAAPHHPLCAGSRRAAMGGSDVAHTSACMCGAHSPLSPTQTHTHINSPHAWTPTRHPNTRPPRPLPVDPRRARATRCGTAWSTCCTSTAWTWCLRGERQGCLHRVFSG